MKALFSALLLQIALAAGARYAIPAIVPQGAASEELAAHFRAGQQALRGGRPADAVREFNDVLRLQPGLSAAEINLGLAYHLLGEYKLAAAALASGLSQNPNILGANIILGLDELKLNAPGRAIAPLKTALHIDPSNQQAWSALGDAQLALGNYHEASQAYRVAAHNGTAEAMDSFRLGHEYLQMAKQLAARLSREFKNSAWTERLAGDTFGARGRWGDAAKAYQLAINRDPAQPGLHAAFGDALRQQGKLAEAQQEYREEERLDSSKSKPCRAGGYEACVSALEKQRRLEPAQIMALGQAEFALRRFEKASDAFAAALARDPRNPAAVYWLASSYENFAERCFSRVSEDFHDSPEARELQAETDRARGDD
ncbi:MAG: tetratricopeptide repeat protein, partial [Terriglobia bacterium]